MTEGLEVGISRYGAGSTHPDVACGVLRAKAFAHGMELTAASQVDMAAAAIGADAWMLVCATDTFELPLQYGEPAVKALAAILTRAAGNAVKYVEVIGEGCASSTVLIRAAESHARWAVRMVGSQAPEALRKAASDLYASGSDNSLTSYAELLGIVADGVEMPSLFR